MNNLSGTFCMCGPQHFTGQAACTALQLLPILLQLYSMYTYRRLRKLLALVACMCYELPG